MSNGLTFPPDTSYPTDPVTGRVLGKTQCAVCGQIWDQSVTTSVPQPCFHNAAELDAFFNTQPPGPSQRQRWKPIP